MATSKIGWTDFVWNPTTGCDRISAGCDHCYAVGKARRLKAVGQAKYQTDGDPRTSGPGFGLAVHPDTLDIPRRWRKPRRIFVNSMSDLFHARVPEDFIRDVFEVMADVPRHTFQITTKRPDRARKMADRLLWPDNVHMGVSVEAPRWLHRVDDLRAIPAAVRWISAEPLLAPLDGLDLDGIAWVVVGGESGRVHGDPEKRARPMALEWARDIRDQCQAAGIPLFVKQLGTVWARDAGMTGKGDEPAEWPEDLRIQVHPMPPGRQPELLTA